MKVESGKRHYHSHDRKQHGVSFDTGDLREVVVTAR